MTAIGSPVARELGLDLYQRMLRVRRFEERCAELYSAGKIRGFLHLYIGEEAVAVGAIPHLRAEDSIFATYREHAHALVRGVSMRKVMAEMFGKVDGCSRGRGGSMHLFDAEQRLFGGNGDRRRRAPAGGRDGARRLHARTRLGHGLLLRRGGDGGGRVSRVDEPGGPVEAADPLPLREQPLRHGHCAGTLGVRDEPCSQGGCLRGSLLERRRDGRSSRFTMRRSVPSRRCARADRRSSSRRAPSGFAPTRCTTPTAIATKEEIEKWKHRDPLLLLGQRMRDEGSLMDEDVASMEEQIAAEIDEAVAFAEASDIEPVEELTRFVQTATAGGDAS